ncbi:MAG TPA: hypothetical protein VEH28_05040 [Thermoplasmata archaeon]|nr:hypothetical protein [Thermoplasmata archaeon]
MENLIERLVATRRTLRSAISVPAAGWLGPPVDTPGAAIVDWTT